MTVSYIKSLENSKLIKAGRASNMAWFWFKSQNDLLVLDVQCPWRIGDENTIYLASGDMFCPCSKFQGEYEDFVWDKQGNNIFDEKIETLFSEEWQIQEIFLSATGDLQLLFTNGKTVQIFIDNSENEEQWRFFTKDSKKEHFVVMPGRFELV